MGLKRALEDENRGRIDHRRDANDRAARTLGARLLFRFLDLLALLGLLSLVLDARLPLGGFAGERAGREQPGNQNRIDDRAPLHAVDVTTPRLNRK